jgi:hypothetical protein
MTSRIPPRSPRALSPPPANAALPPPFLAIPTLGSRQDAGEACVCVLYVRGGGGGGGGLVCNVSVTLCVQRAR